MSMKRKILIYMACILFISISFLSLSFGLFAQGSKDLKQKVEEIFTSYRTADDPGVPELLAELGNPVVPILLEMLEEDPNDIGLIEALGMIGDKRATSLLSQMLLDPDCTNQISLTMALMRIGDSAAEPAVVNFFEQTQSQEDDWQLLAGQALLKVGGEASRQKAKRMVAYVRDLYERRTWVFDEEIQREISVELRESPFYNSEIVHAFLASLIIDSKDAELITKAIKYRQLADETGLRYTDGFKVLAETGTPETIETIFKFAENNEEVWPPAPPEITEAERLRLFSVHPLIRIVAVEALLTVPEVDIDRVTRAFEDIPVEGFKIIPLTVKLKPDKWNFKWKKAKDKEDDDKEKGKGDEDDDDKGKGKINCYLGNIPGGYSVRDIDVWTILLNDKASPSKKGKKGRIHTKIKKHHKGFIGEVLQVKFDKFEAIKSIGSIWPGKECTIAITGRLRNDKPFKGTSRIKISKPEEEKEEEEKEEKEVNEEEGEEED